MERGTLLPIRCAQPAFGCISPLPLVEGARNCDHLLDLGMKIAAIHLGFFYAGGGERLVLEEVRGLKQLGHDVECFAPIVVPEACYPDLMQEVPVQGLLPAPPSWVPARVALWVLLSCVLAPLIALRFRRFDVLFA